MRRAAIAALATLLLAAPPASAELRSGTRIDQRDDMGSAAAPETGPKALGLDIAQVDARYDTAAGDIVVDVQLRGDLAAATPFPSMTVTVGALGSVPSRKGLVCGGSGEAVTAIVSGYAESPDWSYATGREQARVSGPLEVTRVPGRVALRIRGADEAQTAALRGRDLSCVMVTTQTSHEWDTFMFPSTYIRDYLDPVLYFTGHAPDNDADGTTDDIDACPDAKGDGPRGCPKVPTSAPAAKVKRCPRVSLQGKTLKATRKALAKAGCSAGKVRRPKGTGKRTLVVRRASAANAKRRVDLVLKVKR